MTRKILIASSLALSVALAGGMAWSQTPMPDPLDDRSVKRLERMEKVVRELRSIVFQGRDSGKPVVVQPAETDAQLQGLAERIVDLEETLTSINRQNEATTFELDQTRRALAESQATSRALADRVAALEARTGKIEADARADVEEEVAGAAGDPDADFAAARRLMLDGDYDAAYVAFDRFVSRYGDSPKGPEGRYWLGKTLSVRGDHGGAAGAYIGAIRGWPKTTWAPDAVLELSRSLLALKKPADACQTLDELARRYPKAPPSVLTRAQATRTQAKCAA